MMQINRQEEQHVKMSTVLSAADRLTELESGQSARVRHCKRLQGVLSEKNGGLD